MNTAEQKMNIRVLSETINHMGSCDVLMHIDPKYYAEKKLEYEAEYRQQVENLYKSLNNLK